MEKSLAVAVQPEVKAHNGDGKALECFEKFKGKWETQLLSVVECLWEYLDAFLAHLNLPKLSCSLWSCSFGSILKGYSVTIERGAINTFITLTEKEVMNYA